MSGFIRSTALRQIGSAAAACLAAFAPRVAAQSDVPALIARVEGPQVPDRQGFDGYTIAQLMQRFRVPGVGITVIKDFQIHWTKSYGVADVETGRLVDSTIVFQAASISKPVTAMAVLHLVDQGRLGLDADVNGILRSWRTSTPSRRLQASGRRRETWPCS